MSQEIDLLPPCAAELAEELRTHLSDRFHVAVRVREVADGRGYRLYQIQKTGIATWLILDWLHKSSALTANCTSTGCFTRRIDRA